MGKTITVALTDEQGTQLLGQLMSDMSEVCWASGWYGGMEDDLPALIIDAAATRENQEWGMLFIWPNDADIAMALAAALGHWATLDSQGVNYTPYHPKGA